jgi:2-polyprenyl-6-methoxyphenol hydroxylase-like FAD-dependent oxidoreductase
MPIPPSSSLNVDVAIIGGGVAGSSLATALASDGVTVAVIERAPRFRDRVRGEALHPWGAAEADRLGLLPLLITAGGHPLPVWQRYEDRAPVDPYRWAADVPNGHVEWALPHPPLQETLLAHAASLGARVLRPIQAIILGRCRGQPQLELSTPSSNLTLHARLVVGADGSHSVTRRWLGAATVRDPIHHMIGGCLIDGVALDEASTHQAYPPGAMVAAFPQGQGRARVYLVCDPDRAATFRGPTASADFIAACASALPAGAFAAATAAGPTAFFPAADTWADRLAAADLVLIGDAAGANDPSQGHGLSLAFRDARELRDLLVTESNWAQATATFAARRAAYIAPLRAYAQWAGLLTIERGPLADARRERVILAREADPTAGGFAAIYAFGPDGLIPDEAARRHFFGEDLSLPSLAVS